MRHGRGKSRNLIRTKLFYHLIALITSRLESFCHYLAEIRALDNEVGSVYAALEKVGKLDNTLFIFLGEQGPRLPFGKWTAYRYGQHSAFIARYPQK